MAATKRTRFAGSSGAHPFTDSDAVFVGSEVFVQATPASDVSNSLEDDSQLQGSLVAALMFPQTQLQEQLVDEPPQATPSHSSSAVNLSLFADDDDDGGLLLPTPPPPTYPMKGRNASRPSTTRFVSAPPPSGFAAASRSRSLSDCDRASGADGAFVVVLSCQRDKGDIPPTASSPSTESQKENVPTPARDVLPPHNTHRRPHQPGEPVAVASRATSVPTTTSTTGSSVPVVLALLEPSGQSHSSPSHPISSTSDYADPPRSHVGTRPSTLRVAKSAAIRGVPRPKPLSRNTHPNRGRSDPPLPPIAAPRTSLVQHAQDHSALISNIRQAPPEEPHTSIDPELQPPPPLGPSEFESPPIEIEDDMRGQPPTFTSRSENPGAPNNNNPSPAHRRVPTTPTTALRSPAPRGRPHPPSQDSFMQQTGAQEREDWLRSDGARGLHLPVARLAGRESFERAPGHAWPELPTGTSRVRTPSPRRPTSPPKSPSSKSPKARRILERDARSPQDSYLPLNRSTDARLALGERNIRTQDKPHSSKRRRTTDDPSPHRISHTSSEKGKERAREEELSSQMSNMSFESPPSPPPSPPRPSSGLPPHAGHVLVPRTPTNSSGSVPSQGAHPVQGFAGFHFNAPIASLSDSNSQSEGGHNHGLSGARAAPFPRLHSPISYIDSSSEEARKSTGDHPVTAFLPPLSTPPNPSSSEASGPALEITPTQPSDIQDDQHPVAVIARARFTASTTTGTASIDPIPERTPAEIARRLQFGGGAYRKPVAGASSGAPSPLAPPALIARTRQPHRPSPLIPSALPKPPNIFPPARPTNARNQRVAHVARMDVDSDEVVAATPQPSSDPAAGRRSSPERPLASGRPHQSNKGKEVILPRPSRGVANATPVLRPFRPRPQAGPSVSPAKIPADTVDDTNDEDAMDIVEDVLAAPSTPDVPAQMARISTKRRAGGTIITPEKQYSSRSKLAQDNARKKRRTSVNPGRREELSDPDEEVGGNSPTVKCTSAAKTRRSVSRGKRTARSARESPESMSEDEIEMEVEPFTSPEVALAPPPRTTGKRPAIQVKRERKPGPVQAEADAHSPRPSKRRKVASSEQPHIPTTRVFARWNNTKSYYPGTVTGRIKTKFVIAFDDGEVSEATIAKMRRAELREGDVIQMHKGSATINDVDNWCEPDWTVGVIVKAKNGDDKEIVCNKQDFFVAEREIDRGFNDRKLTAEDVEIGDRNTLTHDMPMSSPGPSKKIEQRAAPRLSLPGSAQRRGARGNTRTPETRTPFASIAFVITLLPRDNASETDAEKRRLARDIKRLGGTVYDKWDDVYGVESSGNVRGKQDVKWVCKSRHVDTVLLLADRPTQTAKYLMALALGVPCVSSVWVTDCAAGQNSDWRSYLLAAGTSTHLGTEVSQLFDPAWSNDVDVLHDVFRSQVVRRPWLDMSVLCLFPAAKPSNGDPKAFLRYSQMMCAMGAARVEVVSDARRASQPLADYDYVVVQDGKDVEHAHQDANVGTITWFKQCLITGLLLPL